MSHYRIPWAKAYPSDAVVDSRGRLWFTDRQTHGIGMYDPTDGTFRRVPTPTPNSVPYGRIWVGSKGGSTLHRVDVPADSSVAVEYSLAAPVRLSAEALRWLPPERVQELRSRRLGIGMRRAAAGPDGRLWAAGHGRSRVVGIDPDTGDKRIRATLDQRSGPYAVTVDPWGRVWYSEQGKDIVVVYDPPTGDRRRMALPLEGGTVRDIAVDASRGRIWLPLSDIGVIAVIELDSR